MRDKTYPFLSVIFFGLAAAATWIWTFKPSAFSTKNYTEISGPVVGWQEQEWEDPKATGSGKVDRFLDIHVEKSLLLYRVAPEGYETKFQREAFLNHLKPGTVLTLTVDKAQLDSPSTSGNVLTIDPVVFVRGVRDPQQVYFSLDDYHRATNRHLVIKAVIASVVTAAAGFMLLRMSKRQSAR